MSSDEEEIDSDGTSVDTILRELCMLRCTSCSKSRSSIPTTGDGASRLSSSFEAVYRSPVDTSVSYFEINYDETPSTCTISTANNKDSSITNPQFSLLDHCNSKLTPDPTFYNFKTTEKFLSPINKNRRPEEDFSSCFRRENTTQYEYLLSERCNSPDCACDKHFYCSIDTSISFDRRNNRPEEPRSIGSQVTETSLGLKLNDWNGHIVIQENPTRVRTKIANSTGRWSHPSWSSLDKSADESLLNERCEVSFYSDFSSKKVFHSQDTSLLSIGMEQDHLVNEQLRYDKSEVKETKGQIVETYSKLLHKMEKLKRITHWKSKRRKNKLKYIPEVNKSSEEYFKEKDGIENQYNCSWESGDKLLDTSTVDINSRNELVDEKTNHSINLRDDLIKNQTHSKKKKSPWNHNIHQVVQVLENLKSLSNEDVPSAFTTCTADSAVAYSDNEDKEKFLELKEMKKKSEILRPEGNDRATVKDDLEVDENLQHRNISEDSQTSFGCSCLHVCGEVGRKERIVGGRRADAHEFPWLAMMETNGTFYCGASLITSRHLLTAAHCLYGRNARDIKVILGEHDRKRGDDGETTVVRLKKATMHPQFNLAKIEHDIGILELAVPVSTLGASIKTACIPTKGGRNLSGMEGTVAGWGRVGESTPTSGTLRKVTLPLLTSQECTSYGYPSHRITNNMFCAGFKTGKKDACQGDSGGPIHINGTAPNTMEVIGVVSWGRGCGRPNFPGVYTRVDKYLNWIKQQTKNDCLCHPPQYMGRVATF